MGKRAREKKERRLQVVQGFSKEARTGFLEKACLFIIQWLTYLVLFAPLLVVTSSFFPFVTPKTIFFRVVVEIIIGAYLILAIFEPRWRPRLTPLTIIIGLFLGMVVLTSVLGINFERSFWSTFERMTGLLTMFHLFAFFIVLRAVFKRREDWEKILAVSILVGIILSLYVLRGSEISTRGGGTIGNTSFMAAYLLFSIFFAIILFLSNLFKKEGWPLFWQLFSGVSLLIMLPVLFTSSARGAIISFWTGIFLIGLGYLLFSQKKFLNRFAWAIILSILVLGSTCLVIQPEFVKGKVDTLMAEMKPRFTVWNMAWQAWQERFWLGWGPENFNVAFNKYFNPCLFLGECGGEIWFDRAHNIIFDTGVSSGIIGLISYLAIFGIAFWALFSACMKTKGTRELFIPLGMTALLAVYFVQNLLVFDMLNTYLMFFLSLAFISVFAEKFSGGASGGATSFKGGCTSSGTSSGFQPVLGALVIILTIFCLWEANIKPARSANFTVKMVGAGDAEAAAVFFQKALDSRMEKYEPREQFSNKISQLSLDSGQNRGVILQGFELAQKEMEQSIKKNSLDFRPHLFLGKIYSTSYFFAGDEKKLEQAQEILGQAIRLSPTNQQGYWYLAEVKLAQGETENAIELLKKAVELEPRLNRSHWYLAMAYRIAGQYQLALESIQEAEKMGQNWKSNLEDLKKVIEIYVALQDDANLVSLYQAGLELQPKNTQFFASLAASYANLGQFQKARETALKLKEIAPELASQVDDFLKNLPNE